MQFYKNRFNALKSYRLNKKNVLLIFADAVFNTFYYNWILFINNKYNQLKTKPIFKKGCFYSISKLNKNYNQSLC